MNYRFLLSAALAAVIFCSSTRAEQVVFSEIMYQPPAGKPEFIEISNITITPVDMAKWKFTAGVDFTFPDFNASSAQGHFLKANERIIVSAASEAATRTAYPSIPAGVRIFGPWDAQTALSNDGEKVTLSDKNGVVACTLSYGDRGRWPISADGAGHSLVLANENKAIDDWRVWRASTQNGGSPGVADPALPAAGVALNEAHFDAESRIDWIEFRNNSFTTTLSAAGLFVASKNDFSDKIALSGSLTPGSVTSVTVSFAANNDGEVKLYLIDADNHVRDSHLLTRKPGRDAWQEFPAGSNEWYNATSDTRDAQNNPPRNTDIVINEIMADPPSKQRDGEFVELYNRGTQPVDVSGWKLKEGVNFTIPPGTTMQPGGYLVIGANAAWLNANYANVAAIGNWDGQLANSGEMLKLDDANGNLANAVDYRFGGEWPEHAEGNGSSLELSNPFADNALGGAWRDSDESAKSTFQTFSINGGIYSNLNRGGITDSEIRIWAVSDSHIILKDIVLRPTTGSANLFTNAEVTTLNNNNVDGWQSRGTHAATFHDAAGVHLVADGHGDNKANHLEKAAPTMAAGTAYTLQFQARWVSGKPRLVTQSWDTSWGGTTLVPVPLNLGTPGAANSRLIDPLPPQLTAVRHSPAVPTTSQAVTITARVSSNTPLASVVAFHRLDNINANGTWNTTPMTDSGSNGDLVAGDGIYSGQIPTGSLPGYNANGAVIEFYTHATASNGATADLPKNGAAQPGLWVVDNQVAATDLRRMRVIVSAYWLDALNQDSATGGDKAKFKFKYPRLANRYFPCTFIHNDSEPYYGASVRKTGSPFTRSTNSSLDRARVTLPTDNLFRGKTRLYWDNDGPGGTMLHNRLARYWLYLFGVPGNLVEVCRVTRNNTGYAVRESMEVFDKDMLDRIWENGSDGQFYEMDDKFWIGDDGTTLLTNENGSWDYLTHPTHAAADPDYSNRATSYHNQWIPKSLEVEYDYSGFIEWTKALESPGASQDVLERMADTKMMAAYAAVRGYIADWDSITLSRGKNGYLYRRPSDNKFLMLQWDSDLAFEAGHIGDAVVGSLPNVGTYFFKPQVRRQLNYYLTELLGTYAANGPRIGAWLAAEESSSTSFNVPSLYASWPTQSNGSATRPQIIQSFIASAYVAPFRVTSPAAGSTTTANAITLVGTAPSRAFEIQCINHPEATFSWSSDVAWNLAGVVVTSGTNLLSLRMVDMDGKQIGAVVDYTITKTGDAPPIVQLPQSSASLNVALGEVLKLDGASSYDPEAAGPLTFAWSVTPAEGVTISSPNSSSRNLIFNAPGAYTVTLQVTDAGGQIGTASRTISVYAAHDFDSFPAGPLSGYAVANVQLRDNFGPNSWYSLNDTAGYLVVQSSGNAPHPLTVTSPTYPTITKQLPASADFVLQTELTLQNRQTGTFFTGLLVDMQEEGAAIRYAFGLENGTTFKLLRSSAGGPFEVQTGSSAYTAGPITLRVSREGANLLFQRLLNGSWITVSSRALTTPTTAVSGGIFVATGSTTVAQTLRVAFDYLLLSNPGNSAALVRDLRVTEIMYNPQASSGVEFIELQNVGFAPLDLSGAYFEEGAPWTERFAFPSLVLLPGQYCVVTNNTAGFRAIYGDTALIAGQAIGSLNNDGETIELRDAAGNQVFDFSFVDAWHPTADGRGRSLEALGADPTIYGSAAGWRPSFTNGGTPGFVHVAPSIGTHPAPVTVNPGQPITLEAGAAGVPSPTFQWRKDGQPIFGAISASYLVDAASEGDQGEYDVVVTNVAGSATSNTASVSVNDPVTFSAHPASQVVNPGVSVTFTIAAEGTAPFSYQWRKDGQDLVGGTDASLAFTASEANEGSYDVVVTNVVGAQTSNPATLLVNEPVAIIQHPSNQMLNVGGPFTLTVAATGTSPLTYQWRKAGENIAGANGATYGVAVASTSDQGTYDVVVTNIIGSETSNAASVSINDYVTITQHPAPQVLVTGGTARFSVEAVGSGSLGFVWRKDGHPVAGANSATYVITSVTGANLGSYDVVVSSGTASVTSNPASLSLLDWGQVAGRYQGLLEGPDLDDPTRHPRPGRITATITKSGAISGTLEYFGLRHSFRGKFDRDLGIRVIIPRKYGNPTTLSPVTLAAKLNGDARTLDVVVSHSDQGSGFEAVGALPQIPARSRTSPAPLMGRYTLLLQPSIGAPANLTAPGFLSVSVGKTGSSKWGGKLPDGSKLTGSAWLTSDDQLAFYSSLYAGKLPYAGHIAGPLALNANTASGDFDWNKPQQTKGVFWPGGFSTLVEAEGGRYTGAAKGARAFSFDIMNLTITGPITAGTFNRSVTLGASDKISISSPNLEKVHLSLNQSSGFMTGSYFDAAVRKLRKLQGVVIQAPDRVDNHAAGFFEGTSTTGTWQLARP